MNAAIALILILASLLTAWLILSPKKNRRRGRLNRLLSLPNELFDAVSTILVEERSLGRPSVI